MLGLVVLLFLGRLAQLQLIFGRQNRQLADENRIKKTAELAPRGIIFDRHGRPLVGNQPVYRIKIDDVFKTISRQEALAIEAQTDSQTEMRVDMGREYFFGPVLAHVLGYLSEASPKEVQSGQSQLGDLVGRTGVEEYYESRLRGVNGGVIVEVDSGGQKIRDIGRVSVVTGEDLHLSIDAALSQKAYELLEKWGGKKPGAVVISEAPTGRLLALVSYPSFDPGQITPEKLADPQRPFFDRALSGVYAPGSTFKVVSSTAGLEEGRISASTRYQDTGFIKIGDYLYYNWLYTQRGEAEGEIDLVYALKRSTDTFFYKVGEWVGARRLADWARAFGFGEPTGIDLPNESSGLVPDPDWKQKTLGESWFLGNTYHFAIGQGDLLVTPLQLNTMMSVIANDGVLCAPRVVEAKDASEGGGKSCKNLQLKPETLSLIKEGLRQACATGGTAWPLFDFEPAVVCKTGTAEVDDGSDDTHAWLTAYAPAIEPQIVVTVLVERGGEGSDVAAPVVREILKYFFENS